MIKIGQFSHLTQVSVRMLRHYESLGLLHPSFIDDESGYRYYDYKQLKDIQEITRYRNMGFQLKEIKDLMIQDKDTLQESLSQQHSKLEYELSLIQSQIKSLEHHKQDKDIKYPVRLKTLDKRSVISIRDTISKYSDEGLLWSRLFKEMEEHNLSVDESKPFQGAFYHDDEYKECDVDVEVMCGIKKGSKATSHIKELEKMSIISTLFEESYDHLNDAIHALIDYAERHNLKLESNIFTLYHFNPDNPGKWISEVCIKVS